MTRTKPIPATYADIEALLPNMVGEILFGNLYAQPTPARRHSIAATRLGGIIGHSFDFGDSGPGGRIFDIEPELHLGPHVLVPDAAGWKAPRFTETDDGPWYEVPPDRICEILSPSTAHCDRADKMRIYATYQVNHVWLVDPAARLLEVYERRDVNWLRTHSFADDEDVSAPPFDAISFPLGRLWPFDPPSGSNP